MDEKLKKANSNIEILVDRIIDTESYKNNDNCLYPEKQIDGCDIKESCKECNRKYYSNMKIELLNQFRV